MNKLVSCVLQDYVADKRNAMPEELQTLRLAALWDIWYGPSPITPVWPGLNPVLDMLEKWGNENLTDELWVNTDTEEVLNEKPEETEEDPVNWLEWYCVDLADVRLAVMGKELYHLIWIMEDY